jgi:serine/threonine protein kinase
LAARNILLTSSGTPKISDFGFSRSVEDGEGTTRTMIGPLKYMSPEAIANQSYSTQSDVWSIGIVVWEI